MPLREKKQSNVITNVHGVRFTPGEAKSYLNLIKKANKAVDKLRRNLIRRGVAPHLAEGMAGNMFSETLNIIKNKGGATNALRNMIKQATMRRVVEQKERLINNVLGIIEDRYGLNPRDMERIDEALRSLTVAQFANWFEANGDLVDIIFDTSPVHGARLVSQDEMDYIAERLKQSLGVEL